jgi:uncharacterized protein DUF3224
MIQQAKGPFEVKLVPQKADNPQAEGAGHGRMSIDKRFQGELEATSQGEMLSFMTSTKGSAGYVAIEKVSGTLGGRKGTFVLQHSGTMNRGRQQLSVTVVADSGTDELTGLAGSMKIIVTPDGKHSYEMEYTFAGTD